MPLDHYIPQVYLKNFYSPTLGDRLYAVRKSDLKLFTPNAKGVCAINDGSTNPYLKDDRAVEQFLRTIEPRYNDARDKLLANQIDYDCVYTSAGLAAFTITCSPASVRLHSEILKKRLEDEAIRLDAQGWFSPPPKQLGAANLTELLQRGRVGITVDGKFPQARGISSVLGLTVTFGNFAWEILQNHFNDCSFFTSDFPIAIENTSDHTIVNRVFPVAPNLAVRIRPNRGLSREARADASFRNFRSHLRTVSRTEVERLNRLIVRCAEDMVFFREDQPWVQRFIAKNRYYGIETSFRKESTREGTFIRVRPVVVLKR